MIGQVVLKRYQVVRQLGEGGMSRVYLARQLDQSREVAVKVLLPQMAAQPKVREHFRREIHIMSRFGHPHAIAFYDAEPDGNPPALVMEYLRGAELGEVLERRGRLGVERVGRLLGQLCDVLHAAHEQGVTHRDLKPGNVMVVHPDTPVEKVKLMDFGLAKMSSLFYISPEDLVNVPQPTASGTPEYISPEQIRGNDVDRRSDVYAVGVMLYEMLAGRRPFEGESVEELLEAHLDEEPPWFAEVGLGGEIAPAVEQVVRDCLAKLPAQRPQSCEELARRFEQALGRKIWLPHKATVADDKPAVIYHPRPGSGISPALPAPAAGARRSSADRLATVTLAVASERTAITHQLAVSMIETMAMLKLKGFIHDLGGEIVESVPGMIRVKLDGACSKLEQPRKASLFGWLGGGTATAPVRSGTAIQMELRMEKRDAGQLGITLVLKSPSGVFSAEGKARCEQIHRDLNAYLISR